MRIIFYTGKGGVGKTSISCSTGLKLAADGHKTLILSLDVAHSVADSFDIERELLNKHDGQPFEVQPNLFIQEIDVQKEISRWWDDVYQYITLLLNTTGLDGVVADELAVLPGMQEVSLLLYINKYFKEKTFDVLILDCAPTGESLRFISAPTALEWYMKKIFNAERMLLKAARPLMKVVKPSVPLPDDSYFEAIKELADKLEGVDKLLHDPQITTVRIVTLPEKIVIKETQRAFMYFSLYGLVVDAIIVNRVIPEDCADEFLSAWKKRQVAYLEEIHQLFSPVPIWKLNMFQEEIVSTTGLQLVARELYKDIDPFKIYFKEQPLKFSKADGELKLTLKLPWVSKGDLDLTRAGTELILNVGGFKKHLELPHSFVNAKPVGAKIKDDTVTIIFKEDAKDE